MDNEIVETFAKVAGLGGVSFAFLAIVLRDIIRKRIFRTLNQEQTFRIFVLIIVTSSLIACAGLVLWWLVETNPRMSPKAMSPGALARIALSAFYGDEGKKNAVRNAWRIFHEDLEIVAVDSENPAGDRVFDAFGRVDDRYTHLIRRESYRETGADSLLLGGRRHFVVWRRSGSGSYVDIEVFRIQADLSLHEVWTAGGEDSQMPSSKVEIINGTLLVYGSGPGAMALTYKDGMVELTAVDSSDGNDEINTRYLTFNYDFSQNIASLDDDGSPVLLEPPRVVHGNTVFRSQQLTCSVGELIDLRPGEGAFADIVTSYDGCFRLDPVKTWRIVGAKPGRDEVIIRMPQVADIVVPFEIRAP